MEDTVIGGCRLMRANPRGDSCESSFLVSIVMLNANGTDEDEGRQLDGK